MSDETNPPDGALIGEALKRTNRPKAAKRPPGRTKPVVPPRRIETREEDLREPVKAKPPVHGQRLQRQRLDDNKFDFDESAIPKGMTYEWKRKHCYGMTNSRHLVNLRKNHFKEVPATRHPELAELSNGDGHIEIDGMVLMERPTYLTKEAYQDYYDEAKQRVSGMVQQQMATPSGTFPRNHPTSRQNNFINHDYAPITVDD